MHIESILKRLGLDEHDIHAINSGEIDWLLLDNNELILVHHEHGQKTIGILTEEEVEEVLNAYEFDQRTSGKQSNDSNLFIDGTINNWAGVALNTNWKSLTEHYSKSANILGKNIQNNAVEPYLFLCRHTLELKLKSIIMLGQKLLNLSEDLPSHHDLGKLWTSAYPMILGLKINLSNSDVSHIRSVVDELHESDKNSFTFRYPVSTKNIQIAHGKKFLAFDIQHFRKQFQKAEQSLSNVVDRINHQIVWREIWRNAFSSKLPTKHHIKS